MGVSVRDGLIREAALGSLAILDPARLPMDIFRPLRCGANPKPGISCKTSLRLLQERDRDAQHPEYENDKR